MAKKFVVTAAQKNAAEGLARRAAAQGRAIRPALSKIAGAKVEPIRSK
jgi:hypothetical protein